MLVRTRSIVLHCRRHLLLAILLLLTILSVFALSISTAGASNSRVQALKFCQARVVSEGKDQHSYISSPVIVNRNLEPYIPKPADCLPNVGSSGEFTISPVEVSNGTRVTVAALTPDYLTLKYGPGHVVGTVSVPGGNLEPGVTDNFRANRDGYWSVTFTMRTTAKVLTFDYVLVYFVYSAPHQSGAVTNYQISTISSAVPTPGQVFHSFKSVATKLAISAAAILMIAFPSQLFNHTFLENYPDIIFWWRRRTRMFRRGTSSEESANSNNINRDDARAAENIMVNQSVATNSESGNKSKSRLRLLKVSVVLVIGALLSGFLDPRFGFNAQSSATYVALICSLIVIVAVPGVADFVYRRVRHLHTDFEVESLPVGLVVAVACVLLSRLVHFQPGYLYGVICVVVFASSDRKDEQGHIATLGVASILFTAVAAWLAWDHLSHGQLNVTIPWFTEFLSVALAALFIGGILAAVIGSLPLTFLPGGKIFAWRKDAWAALATITTFIFISIVENARNAQEETGSVITVVVLFSAFGIFSLLFFEHFRRKHNRGVVAAPMSREDDSPIASIE